MGELIKQKSLSGGINLGSERHAAEADHSSLKDYLPTAEEMQGKIETESLLRSTPEIILLTNDSLESQVSNVLQVPASHVGGFGTAGCTKRLSENLAEEM